MRIHVILIKWLTFARAFSYIIYFALDILDSRKDFGSLRKSIGRQADQFSSRCSETISHMQPHRFEAVVQRLFANVENLTSTPSSQAHRHLTRLFNLLPRTML